MAIQRRTLVRFQPENLLDVFKERRTTRRSRADALAGLTVGIVALPLAMALQSPRA